MTLSQWAMKHGVITEGAEPGAFHPYPYQLGIMDAITDPLTEFVTLMKSKRVGYTQIVTFAQGYFIQQDPSPMLVVQPTIDDAKGYSKDTVAPMLEDTPVLEGLISEVKSRDSKNTIEMKQFPGGSLHLRGANSMRGFRRLTKRVCIGDEVDAYPLLPGGDQLKAMVGRTETYGSRRKIILGSTPLIRDVSRIERAFSRSDQRYFLVPCPRCGELQRITWASITWPEGNPERAYMTCQANGCEIDHSSKPGMLEAALAFGDQGWHAEKEFANHAGFHIWAGYSMSPNAAWGQLATEFLEVKSQPEELMTFTNEVLAETWEVEGEKLDHDSLYSRLRSSYENVPAAAVVLTAGVDVQKDRLEVEVVAWAPDQESWSLAYERIYGDPASDQIWLDLDAFLDNTYWHENGHEVQVAATCIDSGSNLYTENVYRYVKQRSMLRRWAVKGQGGPGIPWVGSSSRNNAAKIRLFSLGVDTIKTTLFARLTKMDRGPGFCHFPMDYPESYFMGLTAERAVRKFSRGQVHIAYVHDKRIPNEPIDCRVYAMAALKILNPNWKAYAEALAADDGEAPLPESLPPPVRRPSRRPQATGWVKRW